MKTGICKDTCAPGIDFYKEGREYVVDEKDPFIARHFTFAPEELPDETEGAVEPGIEPKEPPKRGRKKQ